VWIEEIIQDGELCAIISFWKKYTAEKSLT
jgi:hypothetical protein